MTEAGWTRNQPTEAGLYWFRCIDFTYIVEVVDADGKLDVWFHGNEMQSPITHLDGEWLGPITPDSYQQGRVEALAEVERYMAMRLRLAEASLATEILAGNEVKQGRERAAIAELHGMQRHVSDIKEQLAQQAQDEKGVGDGN